MEITEEMYLLAKKIVAAYEAKYEAKEEPGFPVQFKHPALKAVEKKEIGKQYYWRREGWKPEFSGIVEIKGEGGSRRAKGWQVSYVDDTRNILSNRNAGLPDEIVYTQFADDADLFEVVPEPK